MTKLMKMTPGGPLEMDPTEAEEFRAEQADDLRQKNATEYQRLRRAAYPKIGDQLDAIMKWLATESEVQIPAELKSIAMTCMSVKAQFQKPDREA